jgi:hypothetical protein
LGLSAGDADALAEHMIQFTMAGLVAVASGTKKPFNQHVAQ